MTLVAPPTGVVTPSGVSPVPGRRHVAAVWIRGFAAVAVLAAIALSLVLALGTSAVRDGLTVIGHRTAPQVTATEDLYFALADMDAQLANVLLAGDDPSLHDVRTFAVDTYRKDRTRASADLQQAITVAGDDADAQKSVRQVLDQFGDYQSLAAQTILLNDREGNDAGRPSADVLVLQRQATDVIHSVLDTARTLTDTNAALLDQSYRDRRTTTVAMRWLLAGFGGVLVAALIALQVVFWVRMRRRVNPAIAVATLLAGWLVVAGIALFAGESEHLRGAKEDAFDSLIALRQARAVSYDANADESRYLLDPDRAKQYEQDFLDKSQQLVGVGADDVSEYDALLNKDMVAYRADTSDVRIDGFFGTELNNITFTGERDAAEQILLMFQLYQRDDRKIREMVTDGDLRAAIEFCVDTSRGTSNYDFYRYDKALTELIDINQSAFDASISTGEAAIDRWTGLIPYGAGALLVVLVGIGVWPRLAEYR